MLLLLATIAHATPQVQITAVGASELLEPERLALPDIDGPSYSAAKIQRKCLAEKSFYGESGSTLAHVVVHPDGLWFAGRKVTTAELDDVLIRTRQALNKLGCPLSDVPQPLLLSVDNAVSYQDLGDVLVAADHAGWGEFYLHVAGDLREVKVDTPATGLHLGVRGSMTGLQVRWRDGADKKSGSLSCKPAPCSGDAALRYDELQKRLESMHDAHPGEVWAIVSPDGAMPTQSTVRLADTVRAAGFEKVVLGNPRPAKLADLERKWALSPGVPANLSLDGPVPAIRAKLPAARKKGSGGSAKDKAAIDARVRAQHKNIQTCFSTYAIADDPRRTGQVRVGLTIGANGQVEGAKVLDTTLRHERTEACMLDLFKGMSFPPREGGSVQVSYPFAFSPE